jgi:hypothetical protein
MHGMLRAVFGFFLPMDPESQDAEGGHIQAIDGRPAGNASWGPFA